MEKLKLMVSALVVIAGVVMTIGISSFKKTANKNLIPKKLTNYYFQYASNGADNETAYETTSNWAFLSGGNPGTDPCLGDDEMVCVLEAAFNSTPTTTDLTDFLKSLTPSATGAETYCRNNTNIKYKKPLP